MNSAKQVAAMVEGWKLAELSKADIVTRTAEACLGWPYVWGALGEEDTVTERSYYMHRSQIDPRDAELIKERCQVLNGKAESCDGCKYYPNGFRTRIFDCRGFTRWLLGLVGISLAGAGATSQWDTASNWTEKGTIDGIPKDQVCCVFKQRNGKMEHTGMHIGNGVIIHCSVEVKRSSTTDKSWGWTHYAIPKGIDGKIISKPTIRRGDQGPYVAECQQDLIQLDYDVGATGADGKFGRKTEAAVKAFQANNGLKVDGIVGQATWGALLAAVDPPTPGTGMYTVTIQHLDKTQATAICNAYPNASMEEERT